MTKPAAPGTMHPMGATLLIVDDHDDFRAFARALLEAEGFDVVGEASSGQAGISAVVELRPQVVLLDVMLPDVDGFAVCEQITTRPDAPEVVLTSSHAVGTFRHSLERSTARGFITKSDLSGPALTALLG
jgi:two-component system nitrate/nitrite response regulator NarL